MLIQLLDIEIPPVEALTSCPAPWHYQILSLGSQFYVYVIFQVGAIYSVHCCYYCQFLYKPMKRFGEKELITTFIYLIFQFQIVSITNIPILPTVATIQASTSHVYFQTNLFRGTWPLLNVVMLYVLCEVSPLCSRASSSSQSENVLLFSCSEE